MNLNLLNEVDIETLLSTATPAEKLQVLNYLKAVEEYKDTHKIEFFVPDDWQTDAIALGNTDKGKHRMVCAGNRLGKSYFSTYETAVHATGKYPDDWKGFKYSRPLNILVMGVDWSQINRPKCTAELLLGTPDKRGTGWLPREDITQMKPKVGLPNTVSTVYVKHYDEFGMYDGDTRITFDVYSAGMDTLMGMEIDFALMDEQVPALIHSQVITRTWTSKDSTGKMIGRTLYVATPERGMDDVIKSFWEDDGTYHDGLVHVSLWQSKQFTDEEKVQMNESVAPWARQFRIEGIPSAGTGAVFAGILKESLLDNNFTIDKSWKRMCAADLGYKDDMVFSFIAKDDSTGTYYLYDELSYTQTDAIICASGVRPMQLGYIPMILPTDAKSERGLGATYQSIFESAGLVLTKEYARNWYYDSTGKERGIRPGILYMRELMLAGKLKVHPKCTGFLKEFSLYSYDEEGKFIDKDNHHIDSFRYCLMAIDKFGVSEWTSNNTKSTKKLSQQDWTQYYNSQDNY